MFSQEDSGTCVVCMHKVLDTEMGLICDDKCKRTFHSSCMKVPDTEYSKVVGKRTRKWICNRTDCIEKDKNPLSLLASNFNNISSQLNKMITQLGAMSTVPSDVASIKDELKSVNDTLSKLEPRISDVEKRIDVLEVEVRSNLANKNSEVDVDAVYEELADRSRRSHNIILYGIPESSSKTSADRIAHDNSLVSVVLNSCLPNEVKFKSLRIGGPTAGKARPLKIIFSDPSIVATFSKNFKPSTVAEIDQRLNSVSCSRDRTPREREQLSKLSSELKRRSDRGESDLTIRFINGVPKIVKKNHKNL